MVLAVDQQVLKQLLEQLHREDSMIQICVLAERLLEVTQE